MCSTYAIRIVHLPSPEELEAEAAAALSTDATMPTPQSSSNGVIAENGGVVPEPGEMMSFLGESFLEDIVGGSVAAQNQGKMH